VLVTGATGTLGREVVASLDARGGIDIRATSRRRTGAGDRPAHDWRAVDLRVDPLDPLVEGCDAVIHLASGTGGADEDVAMARRLVEAVRSQGVRHLVVVSIVGSDRIPLPYYGSKQRIEAVVRASGVPWSIVRIAQFHSFVERLVSVPASLALPTPIVADVRFQPVDEREAAEVLVDVAVGPPRGDAPDVAGPQVLTLAEIAATWLAETGSTAKLLAMPLAAVEGAVLSDPAPADWALAALEAYRAAANTPTGPRVLGRVTFAEWLRRREAGGTGAATGEA
jgi:uncharacterized protein YbjT (DUF2867 family)